MLKKVLLIDDDPDEADLFRQALSEINPGVAFFHAGNGQDAFEKMKKKKIGKPDILFVDINMPVMNGWQFLKEIKNNNRYKHIPVIMYSVISGRQEINQAIDCGAFGFFVKDDGYDRLKRRLQAITTAFIGIEEYA